MSGDSESFSTLYNALREKEGRVYSDHEVKCLPLIAKQHPHYTEWKLRKKSAMRLFRYLKEKQKPLRILEIGCGNGWLSHLLAGLPNSHVIGCDPGHSEILQAQRVFSSAPNLEFQTLTFAPGMFPASHFDVVVFAASIQYFESFSLVMHEALRLLRAEGEIHILDSPFYLESEVKQAEQNSQSHFKRLGFQDMKNFYFRHKLKDLHLFPHKFLYRPHKLMLRLRLQTLPFPWVCIPKH